MAHSFEMRTIFLLLMISTGAPASEIIAISCVNRTPFDRLKGGLTYDYRGSIIKNTIAADGSSTEETIYERDDASHVIIGPECDRLAFINRENQLVIASVSSKQLLASWPVPAQAIGMLPEQWSWPATEGGRFIYVLPDFNEEQARQGELNSRYLWRLDTINGNAERIRDIGAPAIGFWFPLASSAEIGPGLFRFSEREGVVCNMEERGIGPDQGTKFDPSCGFDISPNGDFSIQNHGTHRMAWVVDLRTGARLNELHIDDTANAATETDRTSEWQSFRWSRNHDAWLGVTRMAFQTVGGKSDLYASHPLLLNWKTGQRIPIPAPSDSPKRQAVLAGLWTHKWAEERDNGSLAFTRIAQVGKPIDLLPEGRGAVSVKDEAGREVFKSESKDAFTPSQAGTFNYILTAPGKQPRSGTVIVRPLMSPKIIRSSWLDERTLYLEFERSVDARGMHLQLSRDSTDRSPTTALPIRRLTLSGLGRGIVIELEHKLASTFPLTLDGVVDSASGKGGPLTIPRDERPWVDPVPGLLFAWGARDGMSDILDKDSGAVIGLAPARSGGAGFVSDVGIFLTGGALIFGPDSSRLIQERLGRSEEFTLLLDLLPLPSAGDTPTKRIVTAPRYIVSFGNSLCLIEREDGLALAWVDRESRKFSTTTAAPLGVALGNGKRLRLGLSFLRCEDYPAEINVSVDGNKTNRISIDAHLPRYLAKTFLNGEGVQHDERRQLLADRFVIGGDLARFAPEGNQRIDRAVDSVEVLNAWSGVMSHLALFDKRLSWDSLAAATSRLSAGKARLGIARMELDTSSHAPDVGRIIPYRSALVANQYKIIDILYQQDVSIDPGATIGLNEWAIRDLIPLKPRSRIGEQTLVIFRPEGADDKKQLQIDELPADPDRAYYFRVE